MNSIVRLTGSTEPQGKVVIYRNRLLPRSETFIRQQALVLRRWQPLLLGEHPAVPGLDLTGMKVQFLCSRNPGALSNAWYRFCRNRHLPHLPTVRTLRRSGASLVHVHFGTDAVDLWPQVRTARLPMLVTLHGYDINLHDEWWQSGKGGRRREQYPGQLRNLARQDRVRFSAVSKAIRTRAMEFGIPEAKIDLAYAGVDTHFFVPGQVPIRERENVVLYVGRLVENKGAHILLQAFRKVVQIVPGASLVVVGDGSMRPDLQDEARSFGTNVRFLGALDSVGVRSEMQRAKIFCQPSLTLANGASEGFGIALLEAQACGLPVISSARGGSREGLLDGRTGFRIDEGDPDALATSIVRCLQDPELQTTLSAAASDFVRAEFNAELCGKRLEALYDVAADPGRRQ